VFNIKALRNDCDDLFDENDFIRERIIVRISLCDVFDKDVLRYLSFSIGESELKMNSWKGRNGNGSVEGRNGVVVTVGSNIENKLL
jgi:hypothetical protein